MRSTNNKIALILVILIVITVAAYWQTLSHDFVNYDDKEYVIENPHIQSGLTIRGIVWAFNIGYAANWHPLTWLSHMLDVSLYGLNPMGHHLSSLVLHILNTLLLFILLYRMTGYIGRSAFVAALFAVHPLHVESVAWVSERKDVLSTFFFMLTLLFYHRYTQSPSIKRYLPVLVLFVLGLMSKPMLVTLPFVLLLLDFWPLGRVGKIGWKKLVIEKIPLFVLSMLSCVITVIAQKAGGAVGTLDRLPLGVRLANTSVSYVHYLVDTLWPKNLAVFYPHPQNTLPVWIVLGSLVALVVLAATAIRLSKTRPYVLCGLLWYFITLLPVIGLVQVGQQAMADRYTYVPLIGVFVAATWFACDLIEGRNSVVSRRFFYTVAAALVLTLNVLCWFQVSRWCDSATLFAWTLRATNGNYLAHNNLGIALAEAKDVPRAIEHLRESVRIQPNYPEARYNLGLQLYAQGELQEAEEHLREAIKLQPGIAKAHNNLGLVLAGQGKPKEALAEYRKALELQPDLPEALNNLGLVLMASGKMDEAIDTFRKAVTAAPRMAEAYNNLGLALSATGKHEEAADDLRKAVELMPDSADLRYNYGLSLAASGDFDEAISQYQAALKIAPRNPEALNALGIALAASGNIESSLQHFRKSISLAPKYADPHCNLAKSLSAFGKKDAAIAEYRRTLALNVNHAEAANNLAWILATHVDGRYRNGSEAVRLAEHACRLTGSGSPGCLDTLAAAYAEAGRFSDAIKMAKRAVSLATSLGDDDMARQIKQRLVLYQSNKAYRE